MADPHLVCDVAHRHVGGRHCRVVGNAEHALSLLVVRRKLLPPVGDACPLRIVEELIRRDVQDVGVDQRSPAHAGSGQDDRVLQEVDALNPPQAEPRRPQVRPKPPRGLRVRRLVEASACIDHKNAVALFRQPQGSDRAAESAADDDDVEALGTVHLCAAQLNDDRAFSSPRRR